MRATAVIFAALLAPACGGEQDTSSVEQEISACQGSDGPITCYATDWPSACGRSYNCNPTGYCPESTQSEIDYCANPANCARPEYGSFCVAGPCPQGVPHFTHWCLLGDPP